MPHLPAPRTFCRIFEPTVFQTENTTAWTTQELHINQGLRGTKGRDSLPGVSNLIRVHDTARTMHACLKRSGAIEVNTEGLRCYEIEDKLQLPCIRGLQPCFDIFRDAERIEHAAAIGLNLKRKRDVPHVPVWYRRNHPRISQSISLNGVHVSPRLRTEEAFQLPIDDIQDNNVTRIRCQG